MDTPLNEAIAFINKYLNIFRFGFRITKISKRKTKIENLLQL